MKKTLIALAALAATSAFAQSSVTLYGVADVALTKVTGSSAALGASTGLNNGTSRLGFKGTEDLGGGLKAGFTFEQAVNLATGATNANTFDRAAWLNLAGGFGDLRLGRSLTPNFYGVAAWELTGTANYSVVANQFGFAGSSRNDAMMMYTSPNFGGFSVSFGHVLKGNNADVAKNSLNAIYKNGPLAVGFSYAKVSGTEASKGIGANYNFGAFQLAGSVMDPAGASKGFSIGGGVQAGPVNIVLDIARDTEAKDTNTLVEVKYPLSKRTFTYVAFVRDGKGKTAENVNGLGLGLRHNF